MIYARILPEKLLLEYWMPKNLGINLVSDQTVNTIKKFMIFADLSHGEIKKILGLDSKATGTPGYQSQIAKLCQYEKGETIIREGEFDSWSFWVVTGSFEVVQNGEVIVVFSKPGEIFGEMSVLEGIPRTATVVTKGGGACLCLDMSVIDNINDQRIKEVIRSGFYKVILERIGKTKEQMKEEKFKFEQKYSKLINFEEKIVGKTD